MQNKKTKLIVINAIVAALYVVASGLGWHDLVFGLGHTIVSFAISALIFKSVKDVKTRMFVLAGVFSVMIFLVAIELNLVLELPFWLSYAQTFFGEIVVLLAGVPLMTALNKAIDLKKLIND